ncbi:hypothetical protein OBBRIDRAFT_761900 [Obba rivulosa]|uniref:Orc1-like AAA ATPase domain-containing protein n=1 Tax=Obba rivulosa TaxID=1052685 RepID=A0A8E2AKW9_9APHY|nr:hypothetical protein OBBRIDRAFT_761900 [Obba rivulosa]
MFISKVLLYPLTKNKNTVFYYSLCRTSLLQRARYGQARAFHESSDSSNQATVTPESAHTSKQRVEPKDSFDEPSSSSRGGGGGGRGLSSGSSVVDAVISTVVGLSMVFVGGIAYVAWYKKKVLDKIEVAFAAGYDPALELAAHGKKRQAQVPEDFNWGAETPWTEHLRRDEQDLVDRIVHGKEVGRYFILLGPKGTGKTTMIYDAMQAVQAEGVAVCDAHPDLEVFRLRLGKALNYEFHEDSQTGLFQRRDPREGGPALDIERALNKLEKVALRYAKRTGRPLVLIFNNIQHFKNDDEGRNMLLQLQQHAESWAASGILTMVFSSDDFWPFFVMRKTASRMQVVSVYDLDFRGSLPALVRMRLNTEHKLENPETFKEALSIAGGRLSYLSRISNAGDMVAYAQHMLDVEKAWLLSQIGLIPDCDDDVMDEQKWSSCSWLLLREFVKMRQEDESRREERIASGELSPDNMEELPLPKIPYYRCRQIMTRPDFLEDLDRANIIAIDINHDVTPDSVLLLHAAKTVVEEEGFDDVLQSVRDRVDEIESLHRTRELTFKDLQEGDCVRLQVDKRNSLRDDSLRESS